MRDALARGARALVRARRASSLDASTSRASLSLRDSVRTRGNQFPRIRRRFSAEDELAAEKVRADVRAGKRPEFVDVAAHVFRSSAGTGGRAGGGRTRAQRGWDWHAWQLLVACVPAGLSYWAVTHIEKVYVPEFEKAMEARERVKEAMIMETARSANAERDEEAATMATRLAELESRVREMEQAVTMAEKAAREKTPPLPVVEKRPG